MGGRPQSFESQNLRILRDLVPFNDKGAGKPPVHDNGAGATLPIPSTYFGPCEPQLLPDNLCQTSIRVGHDIVGTSIDPDLLPEAPTHDVRIFLLLHDSSPPIYPPWKSCPMVLPRQTIF